MDDPVPKQVKRNINKIKYPINIPSKIIIVIHFYQ